VTITIQPFNKANIQDAYQFLLDTFAISFGEDKSKWPNNLGDYSLEKFSGHFTELLKNDSMAIYSVWDSDKLIGQIELNTSMKETLCGYVAFYYLLPEYRNKGLGALLDRHAVLVFKGKGLLKAQLTVSELNLRGIKFYEKNGWRQLGPDSDRPLGIVMEKIL